MRALSACFRTVAVAPEKGIGLTSHTPAQSAYELATRPRRLRHAIATHADLLLPGRYTPADLSTLAVHENAIASGDHLSQTVRGMAARLADNGFSRLASGASSILVERTTDATVRALTGNLFVVGGQGTATALKLTADRAVLLIDPTGGRVTRIATESVYDRTYQHLRDRFSACVPTPGYRATDGGSRLEEVYVPGMSFGRANADVREQITRDVLGQLCVLIEREASLPGAHRTEEGLAVVSHGDLTTENIILTGAGYQVIDLMTLGIRPYWYDTITFLATADPAGLVDGAYDATLVLLHASGAGKGAAPQRKAFLRRVTPSLPPGSRRALTALS
jgi:hypothetical protein